MAEAAAAFVVKGLALKGAEAAVVAAIVEVAVNAAIYAGVNAIARQNSEEKQQGGLIDLQLNSAAPRQLVIGKRMTGGVLVDWYLAGNNNTKLYLPVYLSEGPCGQVTKVYADGRLVWSTPLVHGVRTTIPDFRSGGDRLWLTYYDGRVGQTADATLVGLSQGWTSANKMTGCAWVLIECQWDSDNMRSPPSLSFEMEGAKLYDRRKDTTAGGSGSHRLSDPATWEFSDNPAVALDHFLLGRYWSGARTFGIGLSADEVPYSYFAAQANVCDEDVTLKAGGTQKRYRANGFIFANEDYATTITKLCTAMAARPADFGGRFGVVGVESKTPVLTIDDADLIAGVQEVYTPKRSWSELVGSVEGRFQDPAQLYQPTPYPTVTDATWEAEDGGEPKLMTLDLEMETNVERAQRLALLKARAERRQATLRGVYPLWAVELERGDWFIRTGDKWGEDGKTFEVIERMLDLASYTVTIVSQEVDPADSAWDESTASDGPPAPLDPTDTLSSVSAPSLTVTSNPIVGAASNTPAIKVAFTNPTDPRVQTLFVEVYRDSDGLKVATVPVTIPDDDEQVIIQNGIADGVLYDVRAKFLTPGLSSAWSTTVSATTGATYATGSATSVPWSGVTDSGGKPDDNADVTAANTAAAIAGQGALATQSQVNLGASGRVYRDDGVTRLTDALAVTSLGTAAAISGQGALATLSNVAGQYLAAGVGKNALIDTEFRYLTANWRSTAQSGSVSSAVNTSTNGIRRLSLTGSGVTVGHWLQLDTLPQFNSFPCLPGDWVEGSAYVGGSNISSTSLFLDFRDAAGANTGYSTFPADASPTAGSGELTTFERLSVIAQAPANTVKAYLCVRGIASTAAPVLSVTKPYLGRALQGQTEATPWNTGFDGESGANVTESRTAAAITGQGALATKATIDSSGLVGSGVIVYTALASTAVRLGTNITRNDGTTSLTDALAVTSLGTAAAIASQGALATRSTVLASHTTEYDTSNMVLDSELLDSSYWTVGAGWVFASTDSPEVVTTLAANRAIKSVVGNGTTSQAASATDTGTSQYIGVEADASYRLSGKVLNKSGFTGRARLGVVWYDATKTLISISYVFGNNYTAAAAGSDVVQTITGVVKAPSTAVYARFRTLVEWSTTLANAQRAYFANLRMSRAPQLGNHMVREDGATLLTDASAVTALGTAAAITGQGTGATASSLAGLNATDNANLSASLASAKRLIVSDFSGDARHWTTAFGGSPDTIADPTADGYFDVANIGRVIRITPTQYLQPKGIMKPLQGRRYLQVVRLRAQTDPSSGQINVSIANINGLSASYVHGAATSTSATPVNAISSKSALVVADGWVTLALIWTAGAPSTYDAFWRFRVDLVQTGSGGKVEVAAFNVFDVTDIPVGRALTELFRADGSTALTDASVITSLGTASAITSQGALATLGQVNLGASGRVYRDDGTTRLTDALAVTALGTAAAIASQGGLATLSFVQLNSNVRLQDGTTIITDAIVVTASGTAAGIAGQGNFATVNFYRQSSAPSSPQEGWWWVDTTNGLLKLYTGGAWQTIADITSAATVAAAVAENVFTKSANVGGFTTSGTTIATLATIDVNNVPASGFLKLLNAYLPVGSYTLSAGTTWDGQLIVTEQLQSGGTEYTLHTISVQLDTGLLGFTYEGGNDPGFIYPKNPVAQNVSGNSRYRLKLQRTSGTNNINASPASGGLFQIERTPG
jgi:hypothetical protein